MNNCSRVFLFVKFEMVMKPQYLMKIQIVNPYGGINLVTSLFDGDIAMPLTNCSIDFVNVKFSMAQRRSANDQLLRHKFEGRDFCLHMIMKKFIKIT